jgi:hypothetical protein
MEECYVQHPDLDWYLFPAFRISSNSNAPRKKWNYERNPLEIIGRRERAKEWKIQEIKERKERKDGWLQAKAEGITREEYLDDKTRGMCGFAFLIYSLLRMIFSAIAFWHMLKCNMNRDILTNLYLTFEKYSNPTSKAEDPRKKQIYEVKDMFHFQRKFIF